ncbi:haloacid dehalogenase [Lacrimispora brassicae]
MIWDILIINEDAAHNSRIQKAVESMNSLGIKVTFSDIYNGMVSASKQYKSPFCSVMNQYGIKRKEPYPKELEEPYSVSESRIEKFGFLNHIEFCLSSAEIGISKPDIRIFQMAVDKSNCPPEKAIMIGDRLDNDIYPAKKIGMRTIWIKQGFGGFQTPISDEYEPDFTVNSLDELQCIL